ncbi:MAG: stage sporulation protein [Clostridia bacterium]|jgi:stage V sporulation protein AF|nr:stage sporulation protein [Clostridia bacterium]MDN5322912.1 stage sporulation protein [Clostridia bacterium]
MSQLDGIQSVKVNKKIDENILILDRELGIGKSYDVIRRDITIAGKKAALYFVDGFAKDDIMLWIMKTLARVENEDLAVDPLEKLTTKFINYIETDKTDQLDKIITSVLSGTIVLIIDGVDQGIIIDAREYPARGPEEPDIERVSRGSRDGFVETLVFNSALIRRRIRDPRLRMELVQVGRRSRTDVIISYIEDVANPELISTIKDKLQSINIDGLPMAEKSIEELIMPGNYWNPFPKVRYTERPDVAAVHLLEGHILLIVDTSPSIIILPTTYFHHVQHAEEYRQSPSIGAYLRWVRFFGIISSLFILPLWYLVSVQPELLPEGLKYIGPEKKGNVPLLIQILLAEIGIDLIRMAAIHTPSPLATALGLIAAFFIGEVAINIGLFVPEVILYGALAAVGTFATPSFELGLANRYIRYFLLLSVASLGLIGFIGGILVVLLFLAFMKSFGVPYLWPLIPFDWRGFKSILVRSPVPIQNIRPGILKPIDKTRQKGGTIPAPARKPKLKWKRKKE